MTQNSLKYVYLTVYKLSTRQKYFFYRENRIPHPQKHMYRHQVCDSNFLRTQVMAQNVISKFQWRPF